MSPTDTSRRTDQELIRAIQAGEASAFETLYYRYRDWVVSLSYRFCGNDADAQDVLQETFSYFFKKLEGFELHSQFKTFLYPAVKHLSLSRGQASRRFRSVESVAEPPVEGQTGEGIEEYLTGLKDEQRETVLLRFVDGLSLQEIAAAMDVPLGTVKSRLHAALQAVRKNIGDE